MVHGKEAKGGESEATATSPASPFIREEPNIVSPDRPTDESLHETTEICVDGTERAVDVEKDPMLVVEDQVVAANEDQLVKDTDQVVEEADQVIEPSDQGVDPSDQGVEPSDQVVDPSDQGVEPSDQVVKDSDPLEPSLESVKPSVPEIDIPALIEESTILSSARQKRQRCVELLDATRSLLNTCRQETHSRFRPKKASDSSMLDAIERVCFQLQSRVDRDQSAAAPVAELISLAAFVRRSHAKNFKILDATISLIERVARGAEEFNLEETQLLFDFVGSFSVSESPSTQRQQTSPGSVPVDILLLSEAQPIHATLLKLVVCIGASVPISLLTCYGVKTILTALRFFIAFPQSAAETRAIATGAVEFLCSRLISEYKDCPSTDAWPPMAPQVALLIEEINPEIATNPTTEVSRSMDKKNPVEDMLLFYLEMMTVEIDDVLTFRTTKLNPVQIDELSEAAELEGRLSAASFKALLTSSPLSGGAGGDEGTFEASSLAALNAVQFAVGNLMEAKLTINIRRWLRHHLLPVLLRILGTMGLVTLPLPFLLRTTHLLKSILTGIDPDDPSSFLGLNSYLSTEFALTIHFLVAQLCGQDQTSTPSRKRHVVAIQFLIESVIGNGPLLSALFQTMNPIASFVVRLLARAFERMSVMVRECPFVIMQPSERPSALTPLSAMPNMAFKPLTRPDSYVQRVPPPALSISLPVLSLFRSDFTQMAAPADVSFLKFTDTVDPRLCEGVLANWTRSRLWLSHTALVRTPPTLAAPAEVVAILGNPRSSRDLDVARSAAFIEAAIIAAVELPSVFGRRESLEPRWQVNKGESDLRIWRLTDATAAPANKSAQPLARALLEFLLELQAQHDLKKDDVKLSCLLRAFVSVALFSYELGDVATPLELVNTRLNKRHNLLMLRLAAHAGRQLRPEHSEFLYRQSFERLKECSQVIRRPLEDIMSAWTSWSHEDPHSTLCVFLEVLAWHDEETPDTAARYQAVRSLLKKSSFFLINDLDTFSETQLLEFLATIAWPKVDISDTISPGRGSGEVPSEWLAHRVGLALADEQSAEKIVEWLGLLWEHIDVFEAAELSTQTPLLGILLSSVKRLALNDAPEFPLRLLLNFVALYLVRMKDVPDFPLRAVIALETFLSSSQNLSRYSPLLWDTVGVVTAILIDIVPNSHGQLASAIFSFLQSFVKDFGLPESEIGVTNSVKIIARAALTIAAADPSDVLALKAISLVWSISDGFQSHRNHSPQSPSTTATLSGSSFGGRNLQLAQEVFRVVESEIPADQDTAWPLNSYLVSETSSPAEITLALCHELSKLTSDPRSAVRLAAVKSLSMIVAMRQVDSTLLIPVLTDLQSKKYASLMMLKERYLTNLDKESIDLPNLDEWDEPVDLCCSHAIRETAILQTAIQNYLKIIPSLYDVTIELFTRSLTAKDESKVIPNHPIDRLLTKVLNVLTPRLVTTLSRAVTAVFNYCEFQTDSLTAPELLSDLLETVNRKRQEFLDICADLKFSHPTQFSAVTTAHIDGICDALNRLANKRPVTTDHTGIVGVRGDVATKKWSSMTAHIFFSLTAAVLQLSAFPFKPEAPLSPGALSVYDGWESSLWPAEQFFVVPKTPLPAAVWLSQSFYQPQASQQVRAPVAASSTTIAEIVDGRDTAFARSHGLPQSVVQLSTLLASSRFLQSIVPDEILCDYFISTFLQPYTRLDQLQDVSLFRGFWSQTSLWLFLRLQRELFLHWISLSDKTQLERQMQRYLRRYNEALACFMATLDGQCIAENVLRCTHLVVAQLIETWLDCIATEGQYLSPSFCQNLISRLWEKSKDLVAYSQTSAIQDTMFGIFGSQVVQNWSKLVQNNLLDDHLTQEIISYLRSIIDAKTSPSSLASYRRWSALILVIEFADAIVGNEEIFNQVFELLIEAIEALVADIKLDAERANTGRLSSLLSFAARPFRGNVQTYRLTPADLVRFEAILTSLSRAGDWRHKEGRVTQVSRLTRTLIGLIEIDHKPIRSTLSSSLTILMG